MIYYLSRVTSRARLRYQLVRKDIKFIEIIKGEQQVCINVHTEESNKGAWGMPRLFEAKKDVISCDKLRGLANTN